MLIFWQDREAAEAHAVAAASEEAHSAVHTAAALADHITVVHSEAHTAVASADIIILPHPHIITGRIFTVPSDPGAALI